MSRGSLARLRLWVWRVVVDFTNLLKILFS